jgi:hypothetical protein
VILRGNAISITMKVRVSSVANVVAAVLVVVYSTSVVGMRSTSRHHSASCCANA